MGLSLRQLLTGVTVDQVRTGFLGLLDGFGFQATSWQATSAARILVEAISTVMSDATFAIVDIASSMHAGLASGPYADQLGTFTFNLPRVQATPAQGVMLFTSSAAAPAHTFAANSLLVADSPADDANTFTVVTGGTINPGTTLAVNVIAATPGTASNSPTNLTTLELRTPLVGVSVTNPPQPPATPVNTWITASGTDSETDGIGGRYNARMIGRWDRISPNNTEGAYRAWALEALPALSRLIVRQSNSEGGIRITGATVTGGLSGGQITTITNYINGVSDGVGRRPVNDVLVVASAVSVLTPTLTVALVVHSPFSADAIARVTAALLALQAELPIGGKFLPGASFGAVLLSDLYAACMAVEGIVNVTFLSFSTDIPLGPDDLYLAIPSVTMTVVP